MAKEQPVIFTPGGDAPIGSRIRLLRQASGIRLSHLASQIDYDKGYLSHVERNQAVPSDELLDKVARQFHISANYLRTASIEELVGHSGGASSFSGIPLSVTLPALAIATPTKRRTLPERMERQIANAHLTEDEYEQLAEHLIIVARAMIAFIKAARRRG